MGSCSSAALVESGVVSSTTDAAGWHALCPVTTWGERGRLHRCSCSCHDDHNACTLCHCSGDEFELDPVTRQCADRESCTERNAARIAAHPKIQRYRELDRLTAERRAEEEALLTPEERQARVDRKRSGRATPGGGRCQHCGEATRGGLFLAGHDAKLKGELMRAGQAGDVDAIVELHARGWFPKPGNRTIAKYPVAALTEAEAKHQAEPSDVTIERRTRDRWAANVAAGEDGQ